LDEKNSIDFCIFVGAPLPFKSSQFALATLLPYYTYRKETKRNNTVMMKTIRGAYPLLLLVTCVVGLETGVDVSTSNAGSAVHLRRPQLDTGRKLKKGGKSGKSGKSSKDDVSTEIAPPTAPPTPTGTATLLPTTSAFPTGSAFPTTETAFPTVSPTASPTESSSESLPPSSKSSKSSKGKGKGKGKKSKKGSKKSNKSMKGKGMKNSKKKNKAPTPAPTGLGSSLAPTPSSTTFFPTITGGPTSSAFPTALESSEQPSGSNAPTPGCITEANYQITLDLEDVPAAFQGAFDVAATRWEEIITGDLADFTVTDDVRTNSQCTRLPECPIDDLFICATIEPIDGVGDVLGSAGPEYARMVGTLMVPTIGNMQFDSADVANLVADGSFEGIIVSLNCVSLLILSTLTNIPVLLNFIAS
jgi:hypothetical protein